MAKKAIPLEHRTNHALFSIWKGILTGPPDKAESILKRRIERNGAARAVGPGKALYLENGRLKFTMLTKGQIIKKKSIKFGYTDE